MISGRGISGRNISGCNGGRGKVGCGHRSLGNGNCWGWMAGSARPAPLLPLHFLHLAINLHLDNKQVVQVQEEMVFDVGVCLVGDGLLQARGEEADICRVFDLDQRCSATHSVFSSFFFVNLLFRGISCRWHLG